MTKTITRVYNDYASAEATVGELKNAGLGDSHIGIVASNADGWHKPGGGDVDPKHDKDRDGKDDRAEGAAAGSGIGAAAGGAAGVAAGLGLVAFTGDGPGLDRYPRHRTGGGCRLACSLSRRCGGRRGGRRLNRCAR